MTLEGKNTFGHETGDFFKEVTTDDSWNEIKFYNQKLENPQDNKPFVSKYIEVRNTGSNPAEVSFNEDSNGNHQVSDIIEAGDSKLFRSRQERKMWVQNNTSNSDTTLRVQVH